MAFVLLHSAKLDLKIGDLPDRLVVLPWGANETVTDGRISVGSTTLSELPKNQLATNFDRVALDFNHNTVEGSKWYKGEPAKVAAYASPVVIEGEGLVFEDIDWTPEGREYVAGKHYIDLSAAVQTDAQGEVIFCHSAAVCRQGQVRDLHILATDPLKQFSQTGNHDPNMNAETLKLLLVTLLATKFDHITEESTEEEIEKAVKAFAEAEEKNAGKDPDEEDAMHALSARIEAIEKALKADDGTSDLKVLSAKFESRLEALEKRNEELARDAIRKQALAEGKLIPLSANELTLAQFEKLVDELPAGQVPLDQRTPEGVKTLSSSGALHRSTADDEVRRNLGISEDAWKKHN